MQFQQNQKGLEDFFAGVVYYARIPLHFLRYENQVEINAQYEKTIEEMTRLRNKMQEGTDPYKGMNNAELQKTVIDLQRRRTALESKNILPPCIWSILIHFDRIRETALTAQQQALVKFANLR